MITEVPQHPLTYVQRLALRDTENIELLVVHCTELPDLAMARTFGEKIHHEKSQTGNSGHFYIDRDGSIEQWVPLDRIAHHVRGHNPKSVGIELVNTGRYPDWFKSGHQQMTEAYPEAQIKALIELLNHLAEQIPGLKNMTGHSDLDTEILISEDRPDVKIRRKVDPGPFFPWSEVEAAVALKHS